MDLNCIAVRQKATRSFHPSGGLTRLMGWALLVSLLIPPGAVLAQDKSQTSPATSDGEDTQHLKGGIRQIHEPMFPAYWGNTYKPPGNKPSANTSAATNGEGAESNAAQVFSGSEPEHECDPEGLRGTNHADPDDLAANIACDGWVEDLKNLDWKISLKPEHVTTIDLETVLERILTQSPDVLLAQKKVEETVSRRNTVGKKRFFFVFKVINAGFLEGAADEEIAAATEALEAVKQRSLLEGTKRYYNVMKTLMAEYLTAQRIKQGLNQLDISERRFTSGAVTSFDKIKSKTRLLQLYQEFTQAEKAFQIASLALAEQMGELTLTEKVHLNVLDPKAEDLTEEERKRLKNGEKEHTTKLSDRLDEELAEDHEDENEDEAGSNTGADSEHDPSVPSELMDHVVQGEVVANPPRYYYPADLNMNPTTDELDLIRIPVFRPFDQSITEAVVLDTALKHRPDIHELYHRKEAMDKLLRATDFEIDRARITIFESTVEQASLGLDKLLGAVRLTSIKALEDYRVAKRTLAMAERQWQLAKEGLRHTQISYESGFSSKSDLLDGQIVWAEAQVNYANAILDYNASQIQLLYEMGLMNEELLSERYPTSARSGTDGVSQE